MTRHLIVLLTVLFWGATATLHGGPHLGPFINIWLETGVDNSEPAIAYNSLHDEYLVVWTDFPNMGAYMSIQARRVSGDGTLLSYFTIFHEFGSQCLRPDVAYSSVQDEYLVVYDCTTSASIGFDILARRITWNGEDLHLPPYQEFRVGRPDASGDQGGPAVTYNENNDEYLVVYGNSWPSHYDIDAVRVRASDGTQPSWSNIASGASQFRFLPDVAHCGSSNLYLIAYTYRPSPGDPGDILGKVASWNMSDISPEIHVCDDANNQHDVTVTATPDEFLTVWEDQPDVSTTEIYARRVANDGTPLGPGGGFFIAGLLARHDGAPSVAHGPGSGYLVVWQREITPFSDHDVFGRYAIPGQDNAAGSEFAVDNDAMWQKEPAVACATNGDCLMVEADNSVGGDFEIRGRLVMVHIFSDGFESGNLTAWSAHTR